MQVVGYSNANLNARYKAQNFGQKNVEQKNPNIIEVRQRGGHVPALASAVVPGLGQMIDGRVGRGLAHLGAAIASIGAFVLCDPASYSKHHRILLPALIAGGVIGGFVNWVASISDAYKGGKK